MGAEDTRAPRSKARRKAPDWEEVKRKDGYELVEIDGGLIAMPCPRVSAGEAATPRRDPRKASRLVRSSKDFVAGYSPPDYLIDGILQRRFIYSLTGSTGSGKTALLITLAERAARGKPFGQHRTEQGRVLYFAGENPDDTRMRWIAMADACGFDPETIDVHFIEGVYAIPEIECRVAQEIDALGGVALVSVDTSAAYFAAVPGNDDENDNVQSGNHARALRRLTKLPGGPCVVVACHPVKRPRSADELLPRGGGAFVNEVDGNLTCWKPGENAVGELHWREKFRGPEFEPLGFTMQQITSDKLRDSKGRPVPSVMAVLVSEGERSRLEAQARDDANVVLLAYSQHSGASLREIARALGWKTGSGKDNRQRVSRARKKLRDRKLINDQGHLTKSGREEAHALAGNAPVALSAPDTDRA